MGDLSFSNAAMHRWSPGTATLSWLVGCCNSHESGLCRNSCIKMLAEHGFIASSIPACCILPTTCVHLKCCHWNAQRENLDITPSVCLQCCWPQKSRYRQAATYTFCMWTHECQDGNESKCYSSERFGYSSSTMYLLARHHHTTKIMHVDKEIKYLLFTLL